MYLHLTAQTKETYFSLKVSNINRKKSVPGTSTLRGKHCQHPITEMRVVDTFGLCWSQRFFYG